MKPRRTIRQMDLMIVKLTFYVAIALAFACLFLYSTDLRNAVAMFVATWWR